ncbi:MAG: hypothetical protein AAGC86_15290, partial [Pseudomonadota bacterium]
DETVEFEGDWPAGFVITDDDGVQRADTSDKLSHWSQNGTQTSQFNEQWRSFQVTINYAPETRL